jgi:hypothetical protein
MQVRRGAGASSSICDGWVTMRAFRVRTMALTLAALATLTLTVAAGALLPVMAAARAPSAAARTVHFDGREVHVPAGWPVHRLAEHPRTCVRLDRHAVYLGAPSPNQRCPADALGRRRAIVVKPSFPRAHERARTSAVQAPGPASGAGPSTYTGLGFDACAAPSSRAMTSWLTSPYRAIGIYIGGANRACSQPNLTATWVGEQVAAGWHLIPTYVGLQSPTSACSSCAKLSSAKPGAQGAAAARDAVAKAEAVGIGAGNPIYFDMEAYTRTTSASSATLAFLSAWTTELHELGYVSGVYSSSSSGIADLAHAIGGSYELPDDIWTANWNGVRNTSDPYLPASAWPSHQRIHQYRGGHNESYGLVTINIDDDYVDGATVGEGATSLPPLTVRHVKTAGGTVSAWVRCGESCPGHLVLRSGGAGVGSRAFALGGGRSHTFRMALNSRGRALLGRRGFLRAQLLVAIPQARTTRALRLNR